MFPARSSRFPGLILLLFVCLASSQTSAVRRAPDAPYYPTSDDAVKAMLKLADLKSADVLYDLGCGDGRIVIAAARFYGAHAVGIDINPDRIREAKDNARKAHVENLVRFEENDFFKADIRGATVVTLFLLNSVNLSLRPKLLQDLRPGTRIVSNTFKMGDWAPERDATVEGTTEKTPFSRKIYLWIIPGNK